MISRAPVSRQTCGTALTEQHTMLAAFLCKVPADAHFRKGPRRDWNKGVISKLVLVTRKSTSRR